MDWLEHKAALIEEISIDIAEISTKNEYKEISDWTLKEKLNMLSNKIGLFKDEINKHIIREQSRKQESLLC